MIFELDEDLESFRTIQTQRDKLRLKRAFINPLRTRETTRSALQGPPDAGSYTSKGKRFLIEAPSTELTCLPLFLLCYMQVCPWTLLLVIPARVHRPPSRWPGAHHFAFAASSFKWYLTSEAWLPITLKEQPNSREIVKALITGREVVT